MWIFSPFGVNLSLFLYTSYGNTKYLYWSSRSMFIELLGSSRRKETRDNETETEAFFANHLDVVEHVQVESSFLFEIVIGIRIPKDCMESIFAKNRWNRFQ
uniref:Uncharacterized protein n=1 Tax=Cacopsylla melanoneura TaxID=428564 RepID=A0A8D8YRK6_9HEMI